MNYSNDPEIAEKLAEEGLHYISDSKPGFFRQKKGNDFSYYDLEGKLIKDPKALKRIEEINIPPAWENVWISPKLNTHLQATGIDSKRRKQYIYHPNWIKISEQDKFSKMVDFGLSLPKIRSKISYDMQLDKIEKRKVLAIVVWLLEHTFIRVGNEEYSKENNSYGLTTLRQKHLDIKRGEIRLQFRGKSGVYNTLEISHPTIVKTIKQCVELPGYEIFKFYDDKGELHAVDSQDVNEFLKDTTSDDFTAKDFRTWGATNLSAKYLHQKGEADDPKLLEQYIKETVKKVASHLNNTVSVCRNYYIHPTVIRSYQKKVLVPHFEKHARSKAVKKGLSWNEHALIKLLENYHF